jgi:hypothetical protein
MKLEEYERAVRDVAEDALSVSNLLKAQSVDEKVRKQLRDEPARLEARLKELDEKAGNPDSEIRQNVADVIDGIRLLLEDPAAPPTAEAAVARTRAPKGSSFVAWMPRVPNPPYTRKTTATLASAPPPPPPTAPTNQPTVSEGDELAKLEQALKDFNDEKERLLARHRAVVDEVHQRIRERKLQALRDTLNTEA